MINSQMTHPKYREDIDGLRAIAVFSVIGFHAFPDLFNGGFIGVDVFFVISGFLISTIIFKSLENNSFSFSEFYVRRIKRIIPSLLLVLTASLIFGWFSLLPDEYKQLAKHVSGGGAFISNFILWDESGYFDNTADTKPLLHLWSLGVEEQFYILWPLILWISWKLRINFIVTTTAIFIGSFLLNTTGIEQDKTAVFYSPQTRFWELSSGSILAYLSIYKEKLSLKPGLAASRLPHYISNKPSLITNTTSTLGLFLIFLGILFFNKNLLFPGWFAVMPVLGSVLIISSGQES